MLPKITKLLLTLSGTLTFAAAVLLASGASAETAKGEHEVKPSQVVRPLKVMPLGDSITDGNGQQFPGAYRNHLWKLAQENNFPIDFVGSQSNGAAELPDKDHEGHNGYTIQEIEQQIESWLKTYQPEVILLHIGTNNIWREGEMPTLAPQRLSNLVDKIISLAPNAQLYVASIVPSVEHEKNVREYNSTIPSMVADKAAQGAKIDFVDIYSALTFDDLSDGIHPNGAGYAKMAEKWWSALNSKS